MKRILIVSISYLILTSCIPVGDKRTQEPLYTVPYVDLNRYSGTWYEIARYPNRFQSNCSESRATYTLRNDGNLSVLNECYEKSQRERPRSAQGRAWVVDSTTNSKLKVSFFWPFSGDYWIIELGDDYEYVVIGHPGRKYLWILSRQKKMNDALYSAILHRLKTVHHYDIMKIIKTSVQ